MQTTIDRKGIGAALVTVVAWGMTGIFVRLLPPASPLLITAGRLIVAMVLTAPFLLPRQERLRAALGQGAAWGLALLTVIYYGTAVAAYQMAPVGEVALLISTSPLFALGYRLARRLPIPRREWVGALLALGGVALIVLPNLFVVVVGGGARLVGDGLALLSAAAASFYAIWFRLLGRQGAAPDALAVSLLTFVLGGALLSAGTVLLGSAGEVRLFEPVDWLTLLGLGLFSTMIPTIFYAVASRRLPSVLTTTLRLLIPLFAALFAAVILLEMPSPWVIPGGALVLGGILYMVRGGW